MRLGPVRPRPASTTSGTSSSTAGSAAPSITARAAAISASTAFVHFEQQFVMHLQQHDAPAASSLRAAAAMRTMARRITSAAVPWIGALIAARSRRSPPPAPWR
jgi:uncharacterized protein YeaO (DUF488 family)